MKKGLWIITIVIIVVFVLGIIFLLNNNLRKNSGACFRAGEIINDSRLSCCNDLGAIDTGKRYDPNDFLSDKQGCFHLINIDNNSLCSNCGNGICETWENPCNCPRDCYKFEDIAVPITVKGNLTLSDYFNEIIQCYNSQKIKISSNCSMVFTDKYNDSYLNKSNLFLNLKGIKACSTPGYCPLNDEFKINCQLIYSLNYRYTYGQDGGYESFEIHNCNNKQYLVIDFFPPHTTYSSAWEIELSNDTINQLKN